MNFSFAREVKKLIIGGAYFLSFFFFFINFSRNPERGSRVVNVSNFIARHLSLKSVLLTKSQAQTRNLTFDSAVSFRYDYVNQSF